jgi:uncharacterized protein YukE
MGISIDTVDHGISRTGAEAFKQKIHQEAIVNTKAALGNTGIITSALEAGWQGQAELNFVTNLHTNIKKVQDALDQLDQALSAEFDNIMTAMVNADNEMVPIEE